jgi:glyoxylase-like metal-dependent hydrolase (beta-lactamase superfamily II)
MLRIPLKTDYSGNDTAKERFMKPGYQILALKYAGPFFGSGAMLMWLKDWETTRKRNYYFWCIQGQGSTIIVDAGVHPVQAAEKKLSGYVSPEEVLWRIGIKAVDIRHVILTHLHWDHSGGASLFPNARFYIQEAEYRFWKEDPIARRPPFRHVADESAVSYLASLEETDRLCLLKGDREILPGIECLLAPGHTVALQAVAVNTCEGTAILGSDCAHVFRNYREDWPSCLITNLVEWMKTYDKLRKRVSKPELLFPGHDPLLTENYRETAPDVTLLV